MRQLERARGFFGADAPPEAAMGTDEVCRGHRNRILAVLFQVCVSEQDKVKRRRVAKGAVADAAARGIELPAVVAEVAEKAITMTL